MADTATRKCILKSVNQTHPDIEIADEADTFVGRTRATKLADTLISKQHLKLRVHFDRKHVIVHQLGLNAAAYDGQSLGANESCTLSEGSVLEILCGQYPYKVHFEGCATTPPKKRKRDMDDGLPAAAPTKRIKWQFSIALDTKKPFPSDDSWDSYGGGGLLVYTSAGCHGSHKIAAYDMDGTIITTKSGKVFPTNNDDWKLAFGTVLSTLTAKHNANHKIVIFTNQAGIASGKTTRPNIKAKIERIVAALNVPVQAYVATGDNCFRKPLTGMWQTLSDAKNDGIAIDLEQSVYVGDAAGRPENKSLKKKKDHSHADRFFAANVGLAFETPEQHFLKHAAQKWTPASFDAVSALRDTATQPSKFAISTEPEVILMVGGPGSGKSSFCQKYLKPHGFEVISRDTIGSWQKCVDRLNDCLKRNCRVVVDNTNGDKESRARYVNAAKRNKIPCRCFVMTTSFRHAEHNIAFREVVDTKHAKISRIVLNTYKKQYQAPVLEEGFAEIVHINFVPKFDDDRHRSLYEMHLLSS